MKRLSNWFYCFKQRNWRKKQGNRQIDWRKQLISLYIVRNHDGICLFSHHFQLGLISQIENQMVGMGFTAISQMIQEIVDSSASLVMMDLGPKKVLIDKREKILAILITTSNSIFLREKLEELADYFENMFELQQQISHANRVCLEDYALTTDLVSLVFKDNSKKVLEIIPVIFKAIRKQKRNPFNKQEKAFIKLLTDPIAKSQ